ncbi:MAG TPA: family 16 glycoside hydrolase [Pirellulales bacterium]|nr:family 16 glycoside hydrolase [Pirellulales bacterium]
MTAGFLAAAEAKQTWTFEDDAPGTVPRGFREEVGEWKTALVDRGKVLFQSAKNPDKVFNVVLVDGFEVQDVDLSVRFKAVSGDDDRGGGLVWRAKDKDNYYICRYNPLENNFRLYHVVAGKRTLLDSRDIKHTDGWHTLRVTMRGDGIDCYYDGKRYLDAEDTTFADAGRIGLWTKADARTYFDDLTVSGDF